MIKGKCKLRYYSMFIYNTIEGFSAELFFGSNTKFEYVEREKDYLLSRKGVTLSIPKSDFHRMEIIEEVE